MTRTTILLLLLLTAPLRAESPKPAEDFTTALAAEVFSSALDFTAPRALEPVTAQQLTIWGLRGINALDPSLTPELRDGALRLLGTVGVLYEQPMPDDASGAAWGQAAADLTLAAWSESSIVRRAGFQGIVRSFFDEMFNHLDPYSRYVPPEAANADRARRSGEAGAGLTLMQRGSTVAVKAVSPDGPAADAGVRGGDRILSVDDQPTEAEDAATVSSWIAGPDGTVVTLTLRSRSGRKRVVSIVRAVVPPETVFSQLIGDALVVRIAAFSRDTDERLAHELTRNLALGAGARGRAIRGVILDLRGNRGGLLRQAISATDLVLEGGLVAITAGRNPLASHVWRGGDRDITEGRPIVVLVDGRSASAAEIMAAALSDRGRAVVVGSSTLGKGLVQTITELPDGGELFVTWSRVLAPLGWPLQGLGVLPQVCTSLGQAILDRELISLRNGQQDLTQALVRHRNARAPLPAAEIVELRNTCPAAEGREADMTVARYLLQHSRSYETALIAIAAASDILPQP